MPETKVPPTVGKGAPAPVADAEAALAEWWAEDTRQHNRLGDLAAELGIQVGSPVVPPELNPDGSLKDAPAPVSKVK